MKLWLHILAIILCGSNVCWSENEEISHHHFSKHHRNKRFIWMTHEKRLVWPPGTQLVLTPTLAMPLMRYPPHGIDANFTLSTPFTINFDAMGMTDNQNPIGLTPFLMPGFPILGKRRRRKRAANEEPDVEPHKIAGGERVLLYEAVEDLLFKFGMDGKACLLRAICEMHESPINGNYGLFGEILELFLTPSFSPYVVKMADYVAAEKAGYHDGECWRYYKDCPKSMFETPQPSKYSKEAQPSTDHKEVIKDSSANLSSSTTLLMNDIV